MTHTGALSLQGLWLLRGAAALSTLVPQATLIQTAASESGIMASPCSSNLPHNNRFQLMGRMASNSSYRFPAAASKIRGDIKRSSHFEPNNAHPPPT